MRSFLGLIQAILLSLGHAFVPLSASKLLVRPFHPPPSCRSLTGLDSASSIISAAAEGSSSGLMSNHLMNYFLETLISLAVPTVLGVGAIAIIARIVRAEGGSRSQRGRKNGMDSDYSPLADLYNDLYGDQLQGPSRGGLQQFFRQDRRPLTPPKNVGIPSREYITITNLNQKYQSYRYSMTAAMQTKALAASQYRNAALRKAIDKSLAGTTDNTLASLSTHQLSQLAQTEKEFLSEGSVLVEELSQLQTELTQLALDDEVAMMGLDSVYEPDPSLSAITEDDQHDANATFINQKRSKIRFRDIGKKRQAALLNQSAKTQLQLTKLELKFRRDLIRIAGPGHAASLRAALIGSTSTSLLTALQDRPLSQVLGTTATADSRPANLYVTNFPGDATASQVRELREEVTAICQAARPGDEALVILQTGGGTVTGYGLATGQLLRLKEKGLKLTIAVEQVAASGGYMMCCVADHIVASPFAVLGSIGVISDIPNVYERLKSEGIEFQTVTAGKYKRTLTPTKKVTKEDFQKTSKDLEDVFILFRDFVAENRPQLDITNVATGETWFGTAALERKLCDEIKAVDDLILDYIQKGFEVLEVDFTPPVETVFGTLSPARAGKGPGLLGSGFRWIVQSIASQVKDEIGNSILPLASKSSEIYAKDDSAERTRMEG